MSKGLWGLALVLAGGVLPQAGLAQSSTQGGVSSVSLFKKNDDGTLTFVRTLQQGLTPLQAQQNQQLLQGTVAPGFEVRTAGLQGRNGTGAAAASGGNRWNIWGGASYNRTGYSFQPAQTSGNIGVVMGGVDYRVLDNMLVGVALTSERTRLNLEYVAGGGNLAGDGYSISPYLGYAINRSWSLDASVGYGSTKYDVSGGGVTGNFRGTRTVGSLGASYRYEGVGSRWVVTGRGALLAGTSRINSFTLSNGTFSDASSSSFNQLRLGGQVAYVSGPVTPYVGLSYVYDIKRPDVMTVGGQSSAADRDAWIPVFGLRFTGAGSAYGSLQLSSERGRSQVRNDQLLFNLGVRF